MKSQEKGRGREVKKSSKMKLLPVRVCESHVHHGKELRPRGCGRVAEHWQNCKMYASSVYIHHQLYPHGRAYMYTRNHLCVTLYMHQCEFHV